MDNLISQVPELKLTKKSETRTIHAKDKELYPNHREGDVRIISWYVDHTGKRWSKADVILYLNIQQIKWGDCTDIHVEEGKEVMETVSA